MGGMRECSGESKNEDENRVLVEVDPFFSEHFHLFIGRDTEPFSQCKKLQHAQAKIPPTPNHNCHLVQGLCEDKSAVAKYKMMEWCQN